MPKRVGFLYEQMEDKALIRAAILKSAKGKRSRPEVRRVLRDLDRYTDRIYALIHDRSYIPSQPREKRIYDPSSQKWRDVRVVPYFPDGVIQKLAVMAMEPVLMRGMHHWSCASLPGRGGSRALKKAVGSIQGHPKQCRYAAELDVRHFYPSIPVLGLLRALERKIKDREFLRLIMVIVTCYPGGMPEATVQSLSPEQIAGNRVGLMIGFYINQWLANYYLERVDHLTMNQPGVKVMIRYMDNFTLLGPSKRGLHKAVRAIGESLRKIGLTLKHTWQIYPIKSRMVAIVGYRVDRDHVILRKRNFLRFARQCRRVQKRQRLGKPIAFQQASGLMSRIGALKHCNSQTIRKTYVDPIGVRNLKEVVRHESKRRLAA